MAQATTHPHVGPLLREWRRRRRLSQLELALEAGVSARHLSFLETGRSTPSADMVLRLAETLEVPPRESNALLLAAGHAPRQGVLTFDAPELRPVRDAVGLVLAAHEPFPAIAVDRQWELVAANRGMPLLIAGVAAHLLEPPVNVLRLALHPDGVAPRIINLAQWRHHLLARLERQARLTGDPALAALLAELGAYPSPQRSPSPSPEDHDVFVPLRVRATDGGELRFISTIATFGTAVEATTAELSIEAFLPADDATTRAVRAHALDPE